MNIHRNFAHRVGAAGAALVLTLAACGGDDDEEATATAPAAESSAADAADTAAPAGAVIEISGFAFSGVTSVPAGTVVTIVNNDSASHTLTADDGSFSTGTIEPGAQAEITLTTAGTFTYHCGFHAAMTGSITVT